MKRTTRDRCRWDRSDRGSGSAGLPPPPGAAHPDLRRPRGGLFAVVILAVPAVAGCAEEVRSEAARGDAEAPPVAVAPSESVAVEEDGYRAFLYSEHDADVYVRLDEDITPLGGVPVEAIHVEIGDRVSAGQLLATLEDDDPLLELAVAQPEAEYAAAQHRRMKELFEGEVVTPAEYEEAVLARDRAQARLDRAQLAVSRTRVRAPFSGVVSKRYVRVGQMAEPGKPLFRVTATAPLRARLLVPEERVSSFRPGSPVRLTAVDGRSAEARVLIVSPTVDPASGTREVIVQVRDAGDLSPGAGVRIQPIADGES